MTRHAAGAHMSGRRRSASRRLCDRVADPPRCAAGRRSGHRQRSLDAGARSPDGHRWLERGTGSSTRRRSSATASPRLRRRPRRVRPFRPCEKRVRRSTSVTTCSPTNSNATDRGSPHRAHHAANPLGGAAERLGQRRVRSPRMTWMRSTGHARGRAAVEAASSPARRRLEVSVCAHLRCPVVRARSTPTHLRRRVVDQRPLVARSACSPGACVTTAVAWPVPPYLIGCYPPVGCDLSVRRLPPGPACCRIAAAGRHRRIVPVGAAPAAAQIVPQRSRLLSGRSGAEITSPPCRFCDG